MRWAAASDRPVDTETTGRDGASRADAGDFVTMGERIAPVGSDPPRPVQPGAPHRAAPRAPDATMTDVVTVEPALSRKEQKQESLYAARVKVHPKEVRGTLRTIKWLVLLACLAIYYIGPWLQWDRGPDAPSQALLMDFPNRKFYLFWIEIWPQEIYYLTALLIVAALLLFLATSLAGRVWCGFACPQTVWTDLFMWVERHIEGDRNARMRLDKAPMDLAKLAKRSAKHAIWLVIALLTGGAWIMYFYDAPTLVVEFFTGQAPTAVYFFVGLFTLTTYLLAGVAREQVCVYMCPWPRFQAALLDDDSLIVTYQHHRGEPRGKHKKGHSWNGRGDCIDCKQCVAVCPTGIDIRDGLQFECIGCGLCIDACNSVMDKVERPRGLISFDSDRNQRRIADGEAPARWTQRIVRSRTIVYAVLIVAVMTAFLASLSNRSALDLTVLRDRNPLYVMLSDGSIRNGFTVRIINQEHEPRRYALSLAETPMAEFSIPGAVERAIGPVVVEAAADTVVSHRVFVTLPADRVAGGAIPVTFVVTDQADAATDTYETTFRGPE